MPRQRFEDRFGIAGDDKDFLSGAARSSDEFESALGAVLKREADGPAAFRLNDSGDNAVHVRERSDKLQAVFDGGDHVVLAFHFALPIFCHAAPPLSSMPHYCNAECEGGTK